MKTLLYIFVFEYMLHAHLLLILDLFDKTHSIVHQIFPHCMRFMGLKCRFSHSIKDSHTKEVTQPLTGKTGIRLPCVAFLKAYTFKVHFCKKGATKSQLLEICRKLPHALWREGLKKSGRGPKGKHFFTQV